jgi:hypothetical protein
MLLDEEEIKAVKDILKELGRLIISKLKRDVGLHTF